MPSKQLASNNKARLGVCGLVILIWALFPAFGQCQDIESPRFFKLNFQSLGASTSPVFGSSPQLPFESEQNFLIDASLRFPISMGPQTTILGKIDFEQEVLFGFYVPDEQGLEELELFESSFSLIALHNFNEGLRWSSIVDVSSSSSKGIDLTADALRFSSMNLLEWRNGGRSFGFGAALTYRQSLTVLPVIKYKAPLFGKWSIDALLPSHLLFTNRISNDSRFLFGLRGSAGSYLIRDNEVAYAGYQGDSYKRITVNGVVGYERQLTPWIGLSAEMGISLPYRSGIFDTDNRRLELHNFNDRVSPHFKVGFFLSLPD